MENREAIRKLIQFRRILEKGVFPVGYRFDAEPFDMAIAALEQQEDGGWIPVSKGLPKEREWIGTERFGTTISDEVYVTIEVPSGERITKHMCFQNGSIPAFEQRSIDAFYKGGKAVAWRPLPEPYTEDKA